MLAHTPWDTVEIIVKKTTNWSLRSYLTLMGDLGVPDHEAVIALIKQITTAFVNKLPKSEQMDIDTYSVMPVMANDSVIAGYKGKLFECDLCEDGKSFNFIHIDESDDRHSEYKELIQLSFDAAKDMKQSGAGFTFSMPKGSQGKPN